MQLGVPHLVDESETFKAGIASQRQPLVTAKHNVCGEVTCGSTMAVEKYPGSKSSITQASDQNASSSSMNNSRQPATKFIPCKSGNAHKGRLPAKYSYASFLLSASCHFVPFSALMGAR